MSLETQSRFAAALTDTVRPVPDGLAAWTGQRPERRFHVYRNNVALALRGALAARFPVAETIVGLEFFSAMADEFVARHPPRSPLLLAYGDDFADFVAGFAPAGEIAYLADVIRLETARSHAYHAADAAPLDPALLAGIDPDRLPGLTFVAHPSASVVRSRHPATTIWAMNAGEIPLAPIEDWTAQDTLVARPSMVVGVHLLPPGGGVFLEALLGGAALAEAVEQAVAATSEFDLSHHLAGALQAGAFAAIR